MADEKESKKVARPLKRVPIDQWTPGIQLTWTPAKIKSALISHQLGEFEQACKLATAMLWDDEIPACLSVSTNLIVGADFRLQPIDGDDGEPDPASQAIAEEHESDWRRIHPAIEMGKMFDWYDMVGVAVGTYDWKRVDGKWCANFRVLNPENLWFDDSVIGTDGLHGVWKFHARSGDEIVTPGDGRWVLWSEGRESWTSCGIRALGEAWYGKQQAFRDLMRFNERHGLPILVAKVPAATEAGTSQAVHDDISSIGTDTTITLPSHLENPDSTQEVSFELELLEARDTAFETFFRTLDRIDRKIKMYFLGTNTAELEGTAGSRATQSSGRAIAMQKAQERFNRVRSFIRDQMLIPLIPLMGGSADPDLVPEPVYLIEGDEDLRERAETMKLFGEAINAIGAGYEIKNIEEEARQYGLELEKKKEPKPEVMPGGEPPPPGVQKKGPSNTNGQAQFAATLSDADYQAGADYVEGLVLSATAEAELLEKIDETEMVAILDKAKSPEELQALLAERFDDLEPTQFAHVLEKASILAHLGGYFAVVEDL